MSKAYTVGKYNGEPAILGPGGPYLYAPSERAQMVEDCKQMNLDYEDALDAEDWDA